MSPCPWCVPLTFRHSTSISTVRIVSFNSSYIVSFLIIISQFIICSFNISQFYFYFHSQNKDQWNLNYIVSLFMVCSFNISSFYTNFHSKQLLVEYVHILSIWSYKFLSSQLGYSDLSIISSTSLFYVPLQIFYHITFVSTARTMKHKLPFVYSLHLISATTPSII